MNEKTVRQAIEEKLSRHFGCTSAEATVDQVYKATAMTVKELLAEKRSCFQREARDKGARRVYYLSMEFLLGRSLKNNLCNLGLQDFYEKALNGMGFSLNDVYECEPDAGLGNGGLGRLAACFMDSLTSLDYPAMGFSICYDYGLFRQMIVDGMQIELPDVWLPGGDVWLAPRTDRACRVHFGGRVRQLWQDGHLEIVYEGGEDFEAVPYDMLISGADCKAVSTLRLWRARSVQDFNMGLFSKGQYAATMADSNRAEILTKVLYPSDDHDEGKLLRLSQQYFLVSASCQSIVRDHVAHYGTVESLADKVALHVNDTHPAMCVPELMRILMDEYRLSWERAWEIVTRTVSYTNHTVLPEALETWSEDLFALRLPRIYQIIKEIDRRFCHEAWQAFPGNWDVISEMSIIAHGRIRMANLSVVASHAVNGVSRLHSEILKKSVFRHFYKMYPHRFQNVTNGIAHRRWLVYSNPALASLLDECIGTGYRKSSVELLELTKFADDETVLSRLDDIKRQNKQKFADFLYRYAGKSIDPHSAFDVQIKRLHEYKRQLLNALHIIGLYLDLKEDPNLEMTPRTFLFGAKAAPGYDFAKRIIKLLCMLEREIASDPRVSEKLRVVFLEDYKVSMAELLIPAAEISEQISMAGKEASGTGCMKLMMNGALTIGTLDGANVEMQEAAGAENMFVFGHNADEVEELLAKGYNPTLYYASNERLARIINRLHVGFGGESFADIANYLLTGRGQADPYLCLADFEPYRQSHAEAMGAYADRKRWCRMSLYNIAASGQFAADRSVREYAERIWRLSPLTEKK